MFQSDSRKIRRSAGFRWKQTGLMESEVKLGGAEPFSLLLFKDARL